MLILDGFIQVNSSIVLLLLNLIFRICQLVQNGRHHIQFIITIMLDIMGINYSKQYTMYLQAQNLSSIILKKVIHYIREGSRQRIRHGTVLDLFLDGSEDRGFWEFDNLCDGEVPEHLGHAQTREKIGPCIYRPPQSREDKDDKDEKEVSSKKSREIYKLVSRRDSQYLYIFPHTAPS